MFSTPITSIYFVYIILNLIIEYDYQFIIDFAY